MTHIRKLLAMLCLLLCTHTAVGQQISQDYVHYIERYSQTAIEQMQRYHIPASITLAQALLESAAGTSKLAQKANNHFGIKVGSGWNGPFAYHDDDAKGEKFRKYESVVQSYEDHSKFLLRDRYKPLFSLSTTDYKGWANGLKKCGYATNPNYANLLISVIERYNLTQYDSAARSGNYNQTSNTASVTNVNRTGGTSFSSHHVIQVNGVPCVKAQRGDSWASLSASTGVSVRKLLKYNEMAIDMPIATDSNIFLAKKKKAVAKSYQRHRHRVIPGESMHSISQLHGIRLKRLYSLNHLNRSYQPSVGDILQLR